jgi:hypothetical protein
MGSFFPRSSIKGRHAVTPINNGWRVETEDGELADFTGPRSEERAAFYAATMNRIEFNAALSEAHLRSVG